MTPIRARPPTKNTWFEHDGKEMTFVGNERLHGDPCPKCYFFASNDACVNTDCRDGAYYEKQTYLEMKLLGEIT